MGAERQTYIHTNKQTNKHTHTFQKMISIDQARTHRPLADCGRTPGLKVVQQGYKDLAFA